MIRSNPGYLLKSFLLYAHSLSRCMEIKMLLENSFQHTVCQNTVCQIEPTFCKISHHFAKSSRFCALLPHLVMYLLYFTHSRFGHYFYSNLYGRAPRDPRGVKKSDSFLQIKLLSFCAKIAPKRHKLRKSSKWKKNGKFGSKTL